MKNVFLILHYYVKEESINCVESIKKALSHENNDYGIVVVDNGSPNNSGEELRIKYKDDPNVEVVILSENHGFARGNNIGYDYVKKNYDPEFIIIMNNDIEITNTEFLRQIDDIFKEKQYSVLGPDVYSSTYCIHQSPKRLKHYSLLEVEKIHAKYVKQISSPRLVRIKCLLKRIFWLKKLKYYYTRAKVNSQKEYENVPLHGSCIILSKNFIINNNIVFNPDTFLYFESEILDYICWKKNELTIYSPKIKVIHHQNISTNAEYCDEYKKTMFSLKCAVDSTRVFADLLRLEGSE